MNKVLTSRKIALNTRKRILYCYIWSTLQYGVETWTISENMAKRLSAFEMWAYRRMLRISWTEKVTNEEVLRKVRCDKRLYNIIQTKKLKYFGHIIRQNGDTLPRTLIDGKVKGLRGRGRPRTTWTTNIIKWTGLNYEQAVRLAQDRQKWNHCIQPSQRGRNDDDDDEKTIYPCRDGSMYTISFEFHKESLVRYSIKSLLKI